MLPESPVARSFMLLALVLGALYGALNPPFAVNDERDHWLRVVEITKGRLRSRNDQAGAYYRLPKEYYRLILEYGGVQRDPGARVDVPTLLHELTTPAESPQWMRRVASASAYSPVSYLAQIPAVALARALSFPPLWQIYLARVSSLLSYSWISAWAIASAGQFSWLFFALALLPMSLTQAAGLSADGMAHALSFLFFALIVRGAFGPEPLTRRGRGLLLLLCLLLPVCKAPNLAFTGALLALRWQGPLARAQRWSFAALGIALSIGALLLWNYLNRAPVSADSDDVGRQLSWLTSHWYEVPAIAAHTLRDRGDDYLIQFVAFRDLIHRQMPIIGTALACPYLALLLAVTIGATSDEGRREPRLRWAAVWIASMGLVSAAGVFLAMYLFASAFSSDVVAGVQGRYFIPIAPALLIPLGFVGSHALGRWFEGGAGRRLKLAIVVLNVLTLLALVARYYASPEVAWLH